MTTSQKFSEAATETITVAMAARRDAALQEEIDLVETLRTEGIHNPELEANMIMVFGHKDEKPSPTPKVNFDWKP